MKKIALLIFVIASFTFCKIFNNGSEKGDDSENNDVLKINPGVYISNLPTQLSESSGLIYYNNLFWTFNDSGGDNIIYGFNKRGEIQKEVEIVNADNIDWEDIAQDDKYIYVGDFGNNSGTRKNLGIYKVNKEEIETGNGYQVNGEEIRFSYQNQTEFDFKLYSNIFDCEAITGFDDKLFLFSKNWVNQKTSVYELPKNKGEYILNPVDSFDVNGLITGADISPDKTTLALVGYRNFIPILRLFTQIQDHQFFKGDKIFIEMDSIVGAQTEGICFLGNDTLLISCERTSEFEQQVFYIDLRKVF